MTDINGRTIKVGQVVAFSAMSYGGTAHWINYGIVFEVNSMCKREYCKVKMTKTGNYFLNDSKLKTDLDFFRKVYEFRDDGYMNKKLLILKDVEN